MYMIEKLILKSLLRIYMWETIGIRIYKNLEFLIEVYISDSFSV